MMLTFLAGLGNAVAGAAPGTCQRCGCKLSKYRSLTDRVGALVQMRRSRTPRLPLVVEGTRLGIMATGRGRHIFEEGLASA